MVRVNIDFINMKPQADKFVFNELFSNSKGQSAGALLSAFVMTMVGTLLFAISLYFTLIEAYPYCIGLIGCGTSIYGVESFKK